MKRLIGIFLVLALVGFTLSGIILAASAKVEVTFMSWEGPEMQAAMQKAFDEEFEKSHPNITVKVIPNPLQDYGQKLNALFAAGQLPDVFQTGTETYPLWGAQGKLLVLDNLVAADKSFALANCFPGIIPNWTVKGKLVGMPGLMNTYGIFYNKKAFQDANLALPKPGWTYDEFFKDMQVLTQGDNFGFVDAWNFKSAFYIGQYAASAGDAPFTDNVLLPTKVTAGSAFMEGLGKWQNAVKQSWCSPPGYDTQHVVDEFMAGSVPMFSYGQWGADQLIRNAPADLKWDFAPLPIVKKDVTVYDCVGWAIPSNTKHPKEAYELIKFASTTLYETVLSDFPVAPTAFSTASKPYYATLKAKGHAAMVDSINYMLKAPVKTAIRFSNTWHGDADRYLNTYWDKAIKSELSEADFNKLIKDIQAVVTANKGKQ